MKFKVKNEQTGNKELIVSHNVFSAKNKVEYNGETATLLPNETQNKEMGNIRVCGNIFRGITAQVNNKNIELVSCPTWYEYLLVAITLIFCSLVGITGFVIGLVLCFVFFVIRGLYKKLWLRIFVPCAGAVLSVGLTYLLVWVFKLILIAIL